MQFTIGIDDQEYRTRGVVNKIMYDTKTLTNGHVLLCGVSGSGKSYTVDRMINALLCSTANCHFFDVHSEYNFKGGVAASFGEMGSFGWNPLVVVNHPESGGVRRAVNDFISLLNENGTKLGQMQQSALIYILQDLYSLHGFNADDSTTWDKPELNEVQWFERYKKGQSMFGFHPTLMDLRMLVDSKILHIYTGGDSSAAASLSNVNKHAKRLAKLKKDLSTDNTAIDTSIDDLEDKFEKAKEEAISAYADYVKKIDSGDEVWDQIKFKNTDRLMSIKERLNTISHSGIFAPNPPPFGNSRLCVYQLKNLRHEESAMLVQLRLKAILEEHMRMGQTDEIRTIIVLEEAHLYVSDVSDSHPVVVIANQARKFGIALWLVSQHPSHFPDQFVKNVSTTLFLGIHSTAHNDISRKFNVDKSILSGLQPHKTALARLWKKGESEGRFTSVCVNGNEVASALKKVTAA